VTRSRPRCPGRSTGRCGGAILRGAILRAVTVVLIPTLLVACGTRSPTPAPAAAATTPAAVGPTGSATASAPANSAADPASIGRAFIEALARGDWAGAQAMEDPVMAAAAPAAQLEQIAQSLVAQYGAYQSIGSVATTTQAAGTVAAVPVTFASATVTLNVSISNSGQVVGLHVGQVAAAPSSSPAAYVNPDAYDETQVTVGSAPWALPGTLTMPRGPGPFPGVVLVAGSGPQDRDETFGVNKPFRDLAWGLASAGIAVLRYDKRTFVYRAQLGAQLSTTITVREETTDDAIAAIAVLRATPKVDPARVLLIGHSLGAYLAPRIAAEASDALDGIAMLEANSTPLAPLILIQSEYLASLQGSPDPSMQDQLAALRAAVALAESPSLSPSTPSAELPLGIPASYWLDLRSYDPLATAAALDLPMFLSQGGRDYQVPPSELQGWEQALAGRTNVTVRTYPAMDHLLLDGSGQPTPAEYGVPGHVDAQLVLDLAAWISAR
jgi:dienelactone hydrolase